MLDTYVQKGYKYGVLTYPNECESKLQELLEKTKPVVNFPRKREIETNYSIDSDNLLDFDHLSGLTIKDIRDYEELLYDNSYLIFVMYDSINVNRSNPKEKAIIRYICSVDMKKYDNMKIDDLIGNILVGNELMSKEPYLNQGNKERALGFLEKYIYGDKEHAYNAAFYKIKQK